MFEQVSKKLPDGVQFDWLFGRDHWATALRFVGGSGSALKNSAIVGALAHAAGGVAPIASIVDRLR